MAVRRESVAKVCRECGELLPLDEFYAERSSPDGKKSICGNCFRERRRRRAGMTKEQVAEELRNRPSKVCEGCETLKPRSEFRAKRSGARDGMAPRCKECESTWQREHYGLTRERRSAQAKAWYEANRDRRAQVRRAWYEANKEKAYADHRRRVAADPEAYTEYQRVRRARVREASIGAVDLDSLWTGFCGICGDGIDRDLLHPDPLSKSIDHIVPISRGGAHAQWNLQWTHLACNVRKGASLPDLDGRAVS